MNDFVTGGCRLADLTGDTAGIAALMGLVEEKKCVHTASVVCMYFHVKNVALHLVSRSAKLQNCNLTVSAPNTRLYDVLLH